MRGAGTITFLAGGPLVILVWAVGAIGLPEAYLPVSGVLAELLACLAVVLAWRFRRSRLALAAVTVALANSLLRGGVPAVVGVELGDTIPAVLGLLLPLNLAVLALLRDRPLPGPVPILHLGLILVQPWLVARGLSRLAAGQGDTGAVETWLRLVEVPQASQLVLLIGVVLALLSFAIRRGAFEGGLPWVLLACGLAVLGPWGVDRAALVLAAAELVLVFGLMEDSYRLAYHDELTGLHGRRAFNDALKNLDGGYALAMVDVDHFKGFNDRHGHDAGDQVLRMVARELARVGGGGRSFRYGGEEFAVVFRGHTAAEARPFLEKLREDIGGAKFTIRSARRPRKKPKKPRARATGTKKVAVTVSIGVAGPTSRRRTPEEVLAAADRALYRAKNAGRNRVVKA